MSQVDGLIVDGLIVDGLIVEVLVFGGLRAMVKRDALPLRLDEPSTVAGLLDQLGALYPEVKAHRAHLRVAVNGEYVRDDDPVTAADEIALIPPVAGG